MLLIIILLPGCSTFIKDEILLAEHICKDGEKIQIYFVAVGATANENIQVRIGKPNRIIAIYEHYNNLILSTLDDSVLTLVVTDSTNKFMKTPDTLHIKISN